MPPQEWSSGKPRSWFSITDLLRKQELPGDPLLFLYFAVLVRQYFYWFHHDNIAWVISLAIAFLVFIFYLANKRSTSIEPVGLPFWLLGVLPLVLMYSLRVAFPDLSFDVLNYRILHGERALHGFLYAPHDFFPTPAPYNPAPDMVTAIFRHVFGYRLGTLINLLVMIWTARIVEKFLRMFVGNAWLRAMGVMLVVITEHALFEINNYMADLLVVPLLLEATFLVANHSAWKHPRRSLVNIALLLGVAVAFKLTNAALALPVVLLCVYIVIRKQHEARELSALAKTTLACAAAFIFPIVPFSVALYRYTGSIVFPVFNGLFKSPYWPARSIWDPRWGPVGVVETLLWPVIIVFKPERLSELDVYSGRISFGFVVALIAVVLAWRNEVVRNLSLLVVVSCVLWSSSTGYIRYALYIEVLAGILIFAAAARLAHSSKRGPGLTVAAVLCLVLFFQMGLAAHYVSKKEWGGRPTFIMDPDIWKYETRFLLRDYSLRDFLSPDARQKIDDVDVWVVSSVKTSSIEMMLRPEVPMIGVSTSEYFMTEAGQERYRAAVANTQGKRMFTLVVPEDSGRAKNKLNERGLIAKQTLPIEIPFYSPRAVMPLWLVEVKPSYLAGISCLNQPTVMKVGETVQLQLTINNAGEFVWLSQPSEHQKNVVTAADRWLTADELKVVNDMDSRTAVPHDLQPGATVNLNLSVTAPPLEGQYILEIDMVHEGIAWFSQLGSSPLRFPVRVVRQ